MKNFGFKGSIKSGNVTVNVSVPLLAFKEDECFIVYSPVLDLSGYGKSEFDAKKSFLEALEEFITYTFHKNTFRKELIRLGWKIKHSPAKDKYTPPELDEMISTTEYLSRIIREKDFHKYRETIQLPA